MKIKNDVNGGLSCIKKYWYGSMKLMLDLKIQEINGQYKNFTRILPTNFENFVQKINL